MVLLNRPWSCCDGGKRQPPCRQNNATLKYGMNIYISSIIIDRYPRIVDVYMTNTRGSGVDELHYAVMGTERGKRRVTHYHIAPGDVFIANVRDRERWTLS